MINILIENKDNISHIWLNRPELHNAFNDVMLQEIIDAIDIINNDKQSRFIIIKGKGKSFCSGADLNWMKSLDKNSMDDSLLLSKCFYTIYNSKKPIITIVHGNAFAGANGIIAASDFAYADINSIFSFTEVKLGIIPSCISPYVIKRIGEYPAKDLMISGRKISAYEAQRIGLINSAIEPEKMESKISELIENLNLNAPLAMQHSKKLINKICNELTLEDAYNYTAEMITQIRNSDEAKEGINAFIQKRKANFNL